MAENDNNLAINLETLNAFIDNNKNLVNYLKNSTTWSDSRIEQLEHAEKKAWRVACTASVFSFITLVALIFLLPLKRITTEVIKLDKSTGEVGTLETLKETQITLDEVFTKKFINDFMLAYENYTFDTAELNYYTAAAFMSPALQRQWENHWDNSNPSNPFNIYKNSAKVHIVINSITIHTKGDGKKEVATVRFLKVIEREGEKSITHWVATLSFNYVNAPVKEKLRRINPLGFQVIDYHVDPEIDTSFAQPSVNIANS